MTLCQGRTVDKISALQQITEKYSICEKEDLLHICFKRAYDKNRFGL